MSFNDRRVMIAEVAAVLAGLTFFSALACYQLGLPGPHYDEAIEVLPAIQLLAGQPVEAFRGAGLQIGSRFFPLMVVDYIGAMNTYLSIPFFAVFGINVPAMRLMPVLFALGTLMLTYLFARSLYGRPAALASLFTMVAGISFVFWSRQGIFVTNLTSTLMMGMLVCGLRWWRVRQGPYLWIAAFLAGLGLYTKFIFLWALTGVLGAIVILNLNKIVVGLRRRDVGLEPFGITRAVVAGTLVAFLLGLAPLIVYNVQTSGTFGVISSNLVISYYGVNNLAFGENLGIRLHQFMEVLRGSHFWYLGDVYANGLWPPAFVTVFVVTMLGWVTCRQHSRRLWRPMLFPFLMLALMILQSCFTVSALWFTHYAILIPLPPLAMAAAWSFLAQVTGRRKVVWLTAFLLVLALFAGDVWADVRYHAVLSRSGGYAAHSDAIYELAEILQEEYSGPVVALDWGVQAPVQFLTQGRVAPKELFGYDDLEAPDAAFADRLAASLATPSTTFVLRPIEQEVFRGRIEAFERMTREAGMIVHIQHVIYERSGRLAYMVVGVD